jgi:hypothetical protein
MADEYFIAVSFMGRSTFTANSGGFINSSIDKINLLKVDN